MAVIQGYAGFIPVDADDNTKFQALVLELKKHKEIENENEVSTEFFNKMTLVIIRRCSG